MNQNQPEPPALSGARGLRETRELWGFIAIATAIAIVNSLKNSFSYFCSLPQYPQLSLQSCKFCRYSFRYLWCTIALPAVHRLIPGAIRGAPGSVPSSILDHPHWGTCLAPNRALPPARHRLTSNASRLGSLLHGTGCPAPASPREVPASHGHGRKPAHRELIKTPGGRLPKPLPLKGAREGKRSAGL